MCTIVFAIKLCMFQNMMIEEKEKEEKLTRGKKCDVSGDRREGDIRSCKGINE